MRLVQRVVLYEHPCMAVAAIASNSRTDREKTPMKVLYDGLFWYIGVGRINEPMMETIWINRDAR